MSLRGHWRFLAAIALVALVAAGCKSNSNSTGNSGSVGNKTTIVVGYSDPVTGSLANEGKLLKDGYDFWANTINAKGGLKVGGKSLKVQLKYYDDQSTASTAANNYTRLITQDHVDFLLGPYGSANTIAAEPVAEKNHYVYVNPGGASDSIYSKGYKYVIGIIAVGSQYPTPAINFLAAQSPKPKLAVIYADDSFSSVVGPAAADQAKKNGMDVVYSQQYPTGTKDFSTLITQMKSDGAQVVFGAGHFDESIQLVKQEQQLNFQPLATIQTVGPTTPDFVQTLGAAANGQFGTTLWASTIPGFKDDIFGSAAQYASTFQGKNGYAPDYHSSSATVAGEVLGLAIEKANSLSQDKVQAAFHQLNVMTFGGPFQLKPDGENAKAPSLLGQIQNAQFVAVYPPEDSSSKPQYPGK